MAREQKILPMDLEADFVMRAPSMSRISAFGFDGNTKIEYLITGTDTGQSDESGENLTKYFCKKCEELWSKDKTIGIMWRGDEKPITLYVNEKGEAYRSWKGKLKGRPVCNFITGRVYKY